MKNNNYKKLFIITILLLIPIYILYIDKNLYIYKNSHIDKNFYLKGIKDVKESFNNYVNVCKNGEVPQFYNLNRINLPETYPITSISSSCNAYCDNSSNCNLYTLEDNSCNLYNLSIQQQGVEVQCAGFKEQIIDDPPNYTYNGIGFVKSNYYNSPEASFNHIDYLLTSANRIKDNYIRTKEKIDSQNDGVKIVLENTGKINRYLYNYGNKDYTNRLPAWSFFNSTPTLVRNTRFNDNDFGNYYTFFYDGCILYTEDTKKYFGIASDDDSFLWIIEGYRPWMSIGHSDGVNYNWIVDNIIGATLVCNDRNRHGLSRKFSGYRSGEYTFKANTLYTILVKVTEHGGRANLNMGISNTSLSGTNRRSNNFPQEFGSNYNYENMNNNIFDTIAEEDMKIKGYEDSLPKYYDMSFNFFTKLLPEFKIFQDSDRTIKIMGEDISFSDFYNRFNNIGNSLNDNKAQENSSDLENNRRYLIYSILTFLILITLIILFFYIFAPTFVSNLFMFYYFIGIILLTFFIHAILKQ
tara:strand:+ start:870 stop:2441 length:1572 start_codon:yes stop_codon:yes gene_type:complete